MQFAVQIMFGSGFLLASALIHVASFAIGIPKLSHLATKMQRYSDTLRRAVMICAGVTIVICAHTITVWLWAAALYRTGTFADFSESFYFSMVTYTSLGYGDIVLEPSGRIFASFAAITGLLTFGISTAFLAGYLVRILPEVFTDTKNDRH